MSSSEYHYSLIDDKVLNNNIVNIVNIYNNNNMIGINNINNNMIDINNIDNNKINSI